MTTEQLTQAFITAGYDTPEKVSGLLAMAKDQMTRNGLLLAIDDLAREQKDANATIEAKRQALAAQVQTLTDRITAASQAAVGEEEE